jgi:hypothetical protein
MALQNIRRFGIPAAILGLGTMLAACASQPAPSAVACGPAPAGYAVPAGYPAPVAYTAAPGTIPVAYYAQPQVYAAPAPVADAQFVRTAYQPAVITQPVATRRLVAQPAARHFVAAPKRSVAKSAAIIGSSAGVGAGLGAAIGGKKGAGIGALVGGGGAALWDQLTRRR